MIVLYEAKKGDSVPYKLKARRKAVEANTEVVIKGNRTHLVFKDDVSMNAFAKKATEKLFVRFWDLVLASGDFNSQLTFSTEDFKDYIEPLLK